MSDSLSAPTLRPRPLSPHIRRYKPLISSMLSISHRLSGVLLALGALLLVAVLTGLAYSSALYNQLTAWAHMPLGIGFMMLWSLAFFYHLGNGIRHMFWDIGVGFSIPAMTRSGVVVMLWAIAATIVVWLPFLQTLK